MPPRRQSRALRIRDLAVTYPDAPKPALAGVNLTLPSEQTCLVVGASASGKSTLVCVVAGVTPELVRARCEGEIEVAGTRVTGRRPRELAAWIGTVFQDFELQFFSTAVDLEVAFGLENLGVPRPEMRERVS